MQEWASRKYKSLIQTQIAEDGFQRERRKETTSAAKSFNERTAWHTLIQKNVLGKVHRFKKLRLQPFVRGIKKKIKEKEVFKPGLKTASCNLRKVMGDKSYNATWWVCTSSSWNKPFAHLIMQTYCLRDTAWPDRIGRVSLCWLCCLFNRASLLVREVGTEKWYFALGTLAEVVGFGWPANEVTDQTGKVIGYLPEKEPPKNPRDLIKFLPVTTVWPSDQSEYEAMPVVAQGPLATACYGQSLSSICGSKPDAWEATDIPDDVPNADVPTPRKVSVRGIIAVPTSAKEPLIKAAARVCFREWGVTMLTQLAHHLECELPPKAKLFEVLTKLLQFILAPLEEEALLELLALREFKKDPMETILQSEGMVA